MGVKNQAHVTDLTEDDEGRIKWMPGVIFKLTFIANAYNQESS